MLSASEAQFLPVREASRAPRTGPPSTSLYSCTHQPDTSGHLESCRQPRAPESKATIGQLSKKVPLWESTEARGAGHEREHWTVSPNLVLGDCRRQGGAMVRSRDCLGGGPSCPLSTWVVPLREPHHLNLCLFALLEAGFVTGATPENCTGHLGNSGVSPQCGVVINTSHD